MVYKRGRKTPRGYEKVTFYKREIKKVPTTVKFRRKDGSIATIKTFKTVVVPKKVTFLRRKKW